MGRMNKWSFNHSWCWYGHPACNRRGSPGHREGFCPPGQAERDVHNSMPHGGSNEPVIQQLIIDLDRAVMRR